MKWGGIGCGAIVSIFIVTTVLGLIVALTSDGSSSGRPEISTSRTSAPNQVPPDLRTSSISATSTPRTNATQVPQPIVTPTLAPTSTPELTPTLKPTPTTTPTFDEWKDVSVQIPYNDLFRNNEQHTGKRVWYQAKVIQVIEGGGNRYRLRANITRDGTYWDDTVLLYYYGPRLLEEDIIEFVGVVAELVTYEAILGNTVTIPAINVFKSHLVAEAGDPFPTPERTEKRNGESQSAEAHSSQQEGNNGPTPPSAKSIRDHEEALDDKYESDAWGFRMRIPCVSSTPFGPCTPNREIGLVACVSDTVESHMVTNIAEDFVEEAKKAFPDEDYDHMYIQLHQCRPEYKSVSEIPYGSCYGSVVYRGWAGNTIFARPDGSLTQDDNLSVSMHHCRPD